MATNTAVRVIPVSARSGDIKDLTSVIDKLSSMNTKWYDLGINLKIEKHKVDTIENENIHKGVQRCLTEVIGFWQHNMDPSWEKLVEAIQNVGGYNHIVKLICEERGWEYDSGCESTQTQYSTSDSDTDLSPACGCGNCDIQRICTTGCPHPNNTRKVPILRKSFTDNATVTNVVDHAITNRSSSAFEENLESIKTEFADLVDETLESFKKISLKRLVLYIQSKFKGLSVTEEINPANNVDDLFIIITKEACWWLHYDIIKVLIEKFGSDSDRKRLREYEEHFKSFMDSHFPPDLTHVKLYSVQRKVGYKKMVVKVDREWESTSMNDALTLCEKLDKVFEISESGKNRLHLADISQGCVMLTLMIPHSKAVSIEKELNRDKLYKLANEKILWLKVLNRTYTLPNLMQDSSSDSDQDSAEEIKELNSKVCHGQATGHDSSIQQVSSWNAKPLKPVQSAFQTKSSYIPCDADNLIRHRRKQVIVTGLVTSSLTRGTYSSGANNNPHVDEMAGSEIQNREMRRRMNERIVTGFFTGGFTGGGAGAAIGAIIGSVIPGPGTIIGAILGATIGGIAGVGVLGGTGMAIGDAVALAQFTDEKNKTN